MQSKVIEEANRQLSVCNACRYCEGFCASFQAMTRYRSFNESTIKQMANLCHNCQACYHSCQFTAPHEFDLNLPQALANARAESWEESMPFPAIARVMQSQGLLLLVGVLVAGILFWIVGEIPLASNLSFYELMPHNTLVSLFLTFFFLPLIILSIGLRRYWKSVGGKAIRWAHLSSAMKAAATLKNLDGGLGQGCNYEKGDKYTHTRRWAHQATMYGFLLCFLSTSVATIMHYGFLQEAPYPFWSLPKLFGVTGGVLLSLGTAKLMILKGRSDPNLGVSNRRSGEYGFVSLLFLVSTSGLLLYWLSGTDWASLLLIIHLASIAVFFVTTPYSKMAHGFFRTAALIREAQFKH
jgi:citrate/tricarballylate utilization protein|tara:strand:+ start:1720 stop:2778 length:1059 start_codon:yes stop_codon:yes gene_type:complete